MTKLQVALISLVAAIPGALLAYLMVMVFLNFSGGSSGFLKGLAGVSLLMGATLALMPAGIFVFAGTKGDKAKAPGKAKKDEGDEDNPALAETITADTSEAMDDDEGNAESADDLELASMDAMEVADDADADSDFEIAGEPVSGGDEDNASAHADDDFEPSAESIDDLEVASSEALEFDFDDEDEDDEKPPPGKRK